MAKVSHVLAALAVSAAALASTAASASVNVYQGAGALGLFNTAAGSPPVTISFDAISGNIAGSTISGVTFSSPDGNTLEAVAGASTFTPGGYGGVINANTNTLIPTSGANVLSPGGSNLAPGPDIRQRDSLQLDFVTPLSAFGLDVLHQSFDCCTYVNYFVYNAGGLIASGGISAGAGGGGIPAGTSFFGVYSTAGDITRIVFSEFDDDNQFPDANIGYDTFRFGAAGPGPGIPEPTTWALLLAGFGLTGLALRRSRRRSFVAV